MSGNARSRRRRPAADTSWDALAAWYDGWVGPHGSRTHQGLALPLALRLLDLRPAERVLDVGSGTGVLAPAAARAGSSLLGVDASPRMVEMARRRHGREGRFEIGDARRLLAVSGVRPAGFDAVVFLLSLADMDPLEPILAGAAAALRPSGRLVIVTTHPAFRVPRHSGWGRDPSRGLSYRRVDAYLRPMAVPLSGRTSPAGSRTFHRPISAYVSALAAAGLLVDRFEELPDGAAGDPNPEIPLLLGIRAIRRPDAMARPDGSTIRGR